MNAIKQFSARSAKVIACAVSRFVTGWLIVKLVSWGVISSAWAANSQNLMMASMVVMCVIYALEEMAWDKWGWDIPGMLAKFGVPLMQTTTEVPVAPSVSPQAQPAAPVDPPKV